MLLAIVLLGWLVLAMLGAFVSGIHTRSRA